MGSQEFGLNAGTVDELAKELVQVRRDDLQIEKQIPLVPRSLRLTVEERMNAQGDVLLPLNERALKKRFSGRGRPRFSRKVVPS